MAGEIIFPLPYLMWMDSPAENYFFPRSSLYMSLISIILRENDIFSVVNALPQNLSTKLIVA